jgi:superoxide reductase
MAARLEVYKCELCGNMVEVLNGGEGQLVCCDQPMNKLDEKTADAATEKHVPVIEKIDGGYKITVGSTLHPMEGDHYIQWIELIADGMSYRQFLNPGDEPSAEFLVEAATIGAREHCNKHGLWKSEL